MKEEKRHKRGDVREDCMVFWAYRKSCKNGEWWVTAEKLAELREKKNALQRERMKDPEYREKHNAWQREKQRERYTNDPEYREKQKAWVCERQRERYTNDPEYREKQKARQRERYTNDPEYREKQKAWVCERQRERYINDPEYREKQKAWVCERQRERYINDPEYRAMCEVRSLIQRVEKGGKRSLEIYGVPTKELATKIRRGRLRIYNKYFKGVEKHLDHIRPLAEVKHSIEELHKRSHFTNLLYIPAKENLAKGATPFWEWFGGLTDEKLKRCIAEQDAYNKKIQNELNAEA